MEGIEPPSTVLKTAALPLCNKPIAHEDEHFIDNEEAKGSRPFRLKITIKRLPS